MKKFLMIFLILLCFSLPAQAETLDKFIRFNDPAPIADSGVQPSEFLKWEIVYSHQLLSAGMLVYYCFHIVNPDEIEPLEIHVLIKFGGGVSHMSSYGCKINGFLFYYDWDKTTKTFIRNRRNDLKSGQQM